MQLYKDDAALDGETQSEMFAWLCHQIVTHPNPNLSDVVDTIATLMNEKPLLDLPWEKTRALAYMIRKYLELRAAGAFATDGTSPFERAGGRRDNDFRNFRDISIYPTADEFASRLQPFFQTAFEVQSTSPDLRPMVHLDNQFRLYREDFLAELREDIQTAFGSKTSRRRAQILDGLNYEGVTTGEGKRTHPCHLNVSFESGLSIPGKLSEEGRRKYM